jgi:hypothetical protein
LNEDNLDMNNDYLSELKTDVVKHPERGRGEGKGEVYT